MPVPLGRAPVSRGSGRDRLIRACAFPGLFRVPRRDAKRIAGKFLVDPPRFVFEQGHSVGADLILIQEGLVERSDALPIFLSFIELGEEERLNGHRQIVNDCVGSKDNFIVGPPTQGLLLEHPIQLMWLPSAIRRKRAPGLRDGLNTDVMSGKVRCCALVRIAQARWAPNWLEVEVAAWYTVRRSRRVVATLARLHVALGCAIARVAAVNAREIGRYDHAGHQVVPKANLHLGVLDSASEMIALLPLGRGG